MNTKCKLLIGGIILQIIILGVIITKYEFILQTGQELIVKTQIRDPRDLFRGDYVYISYDERVQNYSGAKVTELCTGDYYNRKIYVTPVLSGNYFIGIQDIYTQKPEGFSIKAIMEYCDMRYNTDPISTGAIYRDSYPIPQKIVIKYPQDRFFVHEGSGLALEAKIRTGEVFAVRKLDSNGKSILSHLIVDGKPLK